MKLQHKSTAQHPQEKFRGHKGTMKPSCVDRFSGTALNADKKDMP